MEGPSIGLRPKGGTDIDKFGAKREQGGRSREEAAVWSFLSDFVTKDLQQGKKYGNDEKKLWKKGDNKEERVCQCVYG